MILSRESYKEEKGDDDRWQHHDQPHSPISLETVPSLEKHCPKLQAKEFG